MIKKITSRQALVEFEAQTTELNDNKIKQRILANRGIASESELDYSLKNLLPYHQLTDIDKATELLFEALSKQQKILIVGDFDADGATSSALCKLVLEKYGAKQVNYLVPNRFDYGYGLSPELVEVAKQQDPDLIITVDNGISSVEGVAKARSYGIKVLITDHHLAGDTLPMAEAIINPNQPGDQFPSKNLAGVGVLFYLLLAFRAHLREKSWFVSMGIEDINLSHYLDLVALGTVADLVQLDYNNRILVHHGLRLMRAGKARPGISQLLTLAKRNLQKITSSDLGFAVGPRLNAAGRLDDMSIGIECLLATDKLSANEYAQILHSLNMDRQEVEKDMQDEALAFLAESIAAESKAAESEIAEPYDHSLCLYQSHWHQGVVGLLASRIKDRVNKPCIVFANEDEHRLKGSARSVKEVHIRDALALVDAQYPNLITKFGGHAMAAGLSLELKNLDEFEKRFDQAVETLLNGKSIENGIETDGELSAEEFSIGTVSLLQTLEPYGQGFPEPMFSGDFSVLEQRIVGQNHLKLTLKSNNSDTVIQAIAFRIDPTLWQQKARKIRAVYRLDINEYYNRPELQLIIQYLEKLE